MKSKELRRERAKIVEDARALLDGVEGTEIPAEINAKFDEMMAAADEVKARIDRVERLEAMEAHLGERIERRAGKEGISIDEATARNEQEKQTFHA